MNKPGLQEPAPEGKPEPVFASLALEALLQRMVETGIERDQAERLLWLVRRPVPVSPWRSKGA